MYLIESKGVVEDEGEEGKREEKRGRRKDEKIGMFSEAELGNKKTVVTKFS